MLRFGLMLAFVAGSGDVLAGPTRRDEADALFNEARRLVDAGRHAEGCPKFEASFALYSSASTMINIARCHERQGKVATAWQDYQRAIALTKDIQDAERRKSLIDIAQEGMQALAPRLPKLRIVIPDAPAGVEVLRDKINVSPAEILQGLAVDPGQHEIRVSAPGYLPEIRTVTLEERKTITVEVTLHLVDAMNSRARGYWRPLGVTFLAGGAIGLGVGAVSGIVSLQKVNDIEARCGGVHCLSSDMIARRELNSAMALGTLSTGTMIAGGILATTGAVFLVLDHVKTRRSRVLPSVGFSVGMRQVTLEGKF